MNTLYNATRHSSSDGTCVGADGFRPTVVQAASSLDAYVICQSLGAFMDNDLFGLDPKKASPPDFTSSLADGDVC